MGMNSLRIITRRFTMMCLLLQTLSIVVFAEIPNPAGAERFANDFFQRKTPQFIKGKVVNSTNTILQYQSSAEANTPLFVFQQKEKGFAMVAQSNNAFRIVGYGDKSDFQPQNLPPQLQSLIKFYEDSLRFFSFPDKPMKAGSPVVEPLLDKYGIMLNQFNHSEVGNCPTGCVATAVTQIMLYYVKHLVKPIKGYGSHCYIDNKYGQICADFENADYTDNDELLSLHVGNAMEMLYCDSPYGSAPRKGVDRIKEHFNHYIGNASPEDYYLKNELEHGRLIYAGLPGDPVGHAVIIDGFDDRGFFHINFGWGGSANGYYLINKNEIIGFSPYKFMTNISGPVIITPTVIPTQPADSLVLVALHNSLGGVESTNWDLSEPVFTWNGVLTFNGRVIELTVGAAPHVHTSQSIPPEIGNLTALRKLHIGGCLNGNIPSTLSNLTELTELSIQNNTIYKDNTLFKGNISGQLPADIDKLTMLEMLSVSNALEGNIPASIGNLHNLKMLLLYQDTIYFGKGKLEGHIPLETGNLKKLQRLAISNHKLTGTLPATFNNLQELRSLELSGNLLSGLIPVLNSPKLSDVRLNDNLFSGIAEGVWNCPVLTTFNAANNQIKGKIPAGFGSLNSLEILRLSNNQIESLPDEIGNLIKLENVDLAWNKLSAIPDGASYWGNLKHFAASNNQIEYVPADFGQLPFIQHIDLSYNRLRFIPEELGNCPELGVVSFNSNKIEKIPESFGNIGKNVILYLQDNEMRGKIPEKLLTVSYEEYGRHVRLDSNRFVFDDIPKSLELKFSVRNQKNCLLNKQLFNVQIGDTVTLDIRELTGMTDAGNEYYWVEYPKHLTNIMYDERMTGIEQNPVKTIIIDEKNIKNKYYCKVFNPDSPTFSFVYNSSTVTSPCMYNVNTDTIAFRLASDEEIIAERYEDVHVVSSGQIAGKTISDKTITLSPPLKVQGTMQWQASVDGNTWYDVSSAMTQADLKANIVSVTPDELVLYPTKTAYYRCRVQDFNCEPLYSDTLRVNQFGTILYDETINVNNESKTISVDSIEVTLPAGLHDQDFRLTITKLDNPPLVPDSVKAGSVYDVSVSFGSTFKVPLLIKFKNIDKSKIRDEDIDRFKAVYFDDQNQKWVPYEYGQISLKDSTLIFETDHLTKLSWWWDEDAFLWGFTDVYRKNGISVFYKETDVETMNQQYGANQTNQSWHVSGYPLYVQDITQYLSEVIAIFKAEELKGTSFAGNFKVYLKKMKGSDGAVGIMGMLAQYITINIDIKTPEKLRSLLAHEFMHYVQDKYIAAHPGNAFWMEAHAHLSDRLVWKDKADFPVSESEHYLLDGRTSANSIYDFLHNSWDYWDSSILTQNYWGNIYYCYLAGTFLHYMRSYRPGTLKLNPATLLKETAWFGSWRKYLDSYIKTNLNSNIGEEYVDFVKFILEGSNKNFTILDKEEGVNPFRYLFSISRNKRFSEKNVYDFTTNNSNKQVDKFDFKIPYLASKILLLNNKTEKKNVVVQYKPLFEANEDYRIYYGKYDFETDRVTYVDISDSTSYNILIEARTPKSTKEITNTSFLLFINKKNPRDIDLSNDFNASFELTALPVLNIENIGMLQMYQGENVYPYHFDDGSLVSITIGHPSTDIIARYTGFNVYSGNISSRKSILNDSILMYENTHYMVNDQGLVKNEVTRKDSTVYKQTIAYDWFTGKLQVTELELKYFIMHTYYEFIRDEKGKVVGERVVFGRHISNVTELEKTYYLRDFMNYIQPESVSKGWEFSYGRNLQVFETKNTAETQHFVEKINVKHKRTNYNTEGNITSVDVRNYLSTDYSSPNLILRMIVHESP